MFLPHERLLKRAGICVDQSLRTSRFWKCSLDREKFCVRSRQGNGPRVIVVVIRESGAYRFHALTCMFAALDSMRTVEFVWLQHFALLRFNSNSLWRSLGIDIMFTFLFALVQWSRFVWITPYHVVLRLTWFKVFFIFQIVHKHWVRTIGSQRTQKH